MIPWPPSYLDYLRFYESNSEDSSLYGDKGIWKVFLTELKFQPWMKYESNLSERISRSNKAPSRDSSYKVFLWLDSAKGVTHEMVDYMFFYLGLRLHEYPSGILLKLYRSPNTICCGPTVANRGR